MLLLAPVLGRADESSSPVAVGANANVGRRENPTRAERLIITEPGVYENYLIDGGGLKKNLVKIGADEVTLRDCLSYGWNQPAHINNAAALNLKNHVDVTVTRCLFRDNEICFRLRGGTGPLGGARVTIEDCAVYRSQVGLRIEDGIRDLKIRRLGIGDGIARKIRGTAGVGDRRGQCIFMWAACANGAHRTSQIRPDNTASSGHRPSAEPRPFAAAPHKQGLPPYLPHPALAKGTDPRCSL